MKFKTATVKKLLAIPVIVNGTNATRVIRSTLDNLCPRGVAAMHSDAASFFAICQELGLSNIQLEDCNDVEYRETLVRRLFHLLNERFS